MAALEICSSLMQRAAAKPELDSSPCNDLSTSFDLRIGVLRRDEEADTGFVRRHGRNWGFFATRLHTPSLGNSGKSATPTCRQASYAIACQIDACVRSRGKVRARNPRQTMVSKGGEKKPYGQKFGLEGYLG
jgi:hypothetical protein